jgi:PIN domain nuclease of toxin-antitoxin system
MLNLDTHILVDALAGRLRPREQALLTANRWSISAIVLWELAKLSQLKRIALDIHASELEMALSKIDVWPIDLEICRATHRLDFKGDPADEIIAATSIVHRVPLLTRDRRLRSSKLVPLAIR